MKRLTAVLLVALCALPALAQKKPLTLDALFDPDRKVFFSGAVQSGFDWVDDATLIWPKKNEKGDLLSWQLFDATTGKARPLFDAAKMQRALEAAGLGSDDAKDAATRKDYTFDATKSAIVVDAADDLYLYRIAQNSAVRLTAAPGEEEVPAFSPDGQKVAFVRANDLYVVDLAGRERRLTTDGSDDRLNGKLDYVYQEEVYGRGEWRAFWWSPDSQRVAFLQLDERDVPKYPIVDELPVHATLDHFHYPKAGDPNPRVQLFIAPANGGKRVAADTTRYSTSEHLIVAVAWKDAATLTFQLQNREQTWLDLVAAKAASGESTRLLRETTEAWVEPLASPVWLADGTFLWQSERTGFRHLELRKADGSLVRQVTKGEWEVRDLHGIDAKSGAIYFSGTERSARDLDVYRINLDGSGLQRLSDVAGTHTVRFNPSMTLYLDRWNDLNTPDQARVHRNDGRVASVVDENRVTAFAEYAWSKPELLQVKTRDGFVMEGMMIKPPNFDPAKKYAVFHHVYGGPHAQEVRNMWRPSRMFSQQWMAAQGVIVWVLDTRTASGKGARSAWGAYKNLGAAELPDIEEGLTWLKSQPYIDGNRVLISGWSYGGFLTLYAMTHSKSFAAGIAGAPVTDWRNYDSIYTERVLLTPQSNPDGYRKSSPLHDAKDLHGALLVIHGTTDDNVHPQNTVQLAYQLQKEGTLFEMMTYAKQRHTFTNQKQIKHLQATMADFVKRHLLAGASQ